MKRLRTKVVKNIKLTSKKLLVNKLKTYLILFGIYTKKYFLGFSLKDFNFSKNSISKNTKYGFTLVELIVVIVILAILSTIGFMSYSSYTYDAKQVVKLSDMKMLNDAIVLDDANGYKFNTQTAKPITFAAYPDDVISYVGPLEDGMIKSVVKAPKDPFTGEPYIVGINPEGNYMQVATAFQKKKYLQVGDEQSINDAIPVQRVVGNYKKNDIEGVSGVIPRWALENFESFKQTKFYTNGEKMFGAFMAKTPNIGNYNNNYIFAMDEAPLTQVVGYTNEKTILYESFENQKINIEMDKGGKWNGFKKFPICSSPNISQVLSSEFNTNSDGIQTVDCDIDTNIGVKSKSSLYLNWLRDSTWGDGNYNYLLVNPKKKYKGYFDIKGKITGRLSLILRTIKPRVKNTYSNILSNISFTPTLSESTFQRINFYINTPDPSGNGLSLNFPEDMEGYGIFLFYRDSNLKAGDQLWFDNFVLEEIQ